MSQLADKTVCIFGNSRCSVDAEEYRHAEQLGRLLGRAGAIVCTGGYDGVMEAASRGARRAGGVVIGVTVDIFD
ncbi:MAG: LOG family protein, partial [Acidobacteria bacterium]